MTFYILLIAISITLVLLLGLARKDRDAQRIRNHLHKQGGRLIEARGWPLSPGWLENKEQRTFEVRYHDRDGNEHEALCQTSARGDVHFKDDRIVQFNQTDKETIASLTAENRRLREELAILRATIRPSPPACEPNPSKTHHTDSSSS